MTVFIAMRWVPETRDEHASSHFDVMGAVLAAAALGGATYALIQWVGVSAWIAVAVGALSAVGFLAVESREREPMLVLSIFRNLTFSAANVMTLVVYGALGAMSFFVTIQLQTVSGYGALAAGAAFIPSTLLMIGFASRPGRLSMQEIRDLLAKKSVDSPMLDDTLAAVLADAVTNRTPPDQAAAMVAARVGADECTAFTMVIFAPATSCVPPLFIGEICLAPFFSSQVHSSKMPTTMGLCFFASLTASAMCFSTSRPWARCVRFGFTFQSFCTNPA